MSEQPRRRNTRIRRTSPKKPPPQDEPKLNGHDPEQPEQPETSPENPTENPTENPAGEPKPERDLNATFGLNGTSDGAGEGAGTDAAAKAEELKKEIERLKEIKAADPVHYELERNAAAKLFGVGVRFVDGQVNERLEGDEAQDETEGNLQPVPEPVNGAELADDLARALRRFVVFDTPATADAVTLWVLGTYLMDEWTLFPKLLISSPTRGCGKSTLLETVEAHVPNARMAANVSGAALFRAASGRPRPTFLFDEVDRYLDTNETLKGIINAGHKRRQAFIERVEESNGKWKVRRFACWAAQALAGIGDPDSTIKDRSIRAELRRKLRSDRTEKLPANFYEQRVHFRRRALRWALDSAITITSDLREPQVLSSDRAADNWTPLLAISRALGPAWEARALAAYEALETHVEDDDSLATLALKDMAEIARDRHDEHIPSDVFTYAMNGMAHRPWATINQGGPLNQHRLAKIVKPYKIRPSRKRMGGNRNEDRVRGYDRQTILDTFARYIDSP